MLNLIHAWGNMNRMLNIILFINLYVLTFWKLIYTRYHGKKLRILIASIMTDWTTSKTNWERSTMLKLARNGRSLSFGYLIVLTGGLLSAYYFRLEPVLRNIHQPQRYLIYRFDYIQKSPNYEITCIIQICSSTFVGLSNYGVDNFISILVLHICAQLINLRSTLKNSIDELGNKSICSSKFRKSLAAIVIRHKHLIRNVRTINDCYSSVLFVNLLCNSFQLCTVTFLIFTAIIDNLDVSPLKISFLAFAIFIELMKLYIYCYAAERLLTESTNMAYGVYLMQMIYNILAKDAKDLMLIVYQSMIPLKLMAGIFGNFSIELFGIVVKMVNGIFICVINNKRIKDIISN